MIPVATIIVAGFLHMLTPLQAHQHVLNFFIMYGLTGVLTNCIKLQVRSVTLWHMHEPRHSLAVSLERLYL